MTAIHDTDVCIVGGGLAGLTLGCGLAAHGLTVVAIDAQAPDAAVNAAFDGRATAIAHASIQMLRAIGIWRHLDGLAQPILEIRVSDGSAPQFLHFDHAALGDGPLGAMVENRHIRQALFARAGELDGLTLMAPERLARVARTADGVVAELAGGGCVRAPLIVGADGRNSWLRRDAGIRTARWSYPQSGIVATIAHALSHCAVAHERFLPAGPFAILPLTGHRSSLVWTTKTSLTPTIMALDDRGFQAEVRRRVGDFLGTVEVIGRRWSYPLGLHMADRFIDRRLALVGDAAHGIHPIAGQGLNLGFRDIAALIEVLVEADRIGLDPGADTVLERYQQWRRVDSVVLAAVTDGLNRLFSNDVAPIRLARDWGLAAVNRIDPLKRFFMHHARGTVGKLPKLLTGAPV